MEPQGRETSSQVPLLIMAPYSSFIAARKLGSTCAARTKDEIGDGVDGDIEDQVIRKHPKTRLGPSDHSMRIHQRSHRYGRRRSSIRRRQSKACGRRWHGLPRSLGLDDRRGRPLTRWWTIHCRRRCSSRAWRSRSRCSGTRRSWGRLSLMRRSRHHRGRTGPKSRRDGQCEQRSHKWLEAQGNHQGGLASRRGGRTCRGSQVLVAETVEPDSKKI
jgi:hypothetical protein